MSDAWRLDGKSALVTGGTKGIGRGGAEQLVAFGANVLVVARTAEPALPRGITQIVADVTRAEDRARIAAAAPAELHVLVHNAGGNIRKPLVGYDDATLAQLLDLNLTSPLS